MQSNIQLFYGIILGQCTYSLKSFIFNDEDYDQKSIGFYCIWLLNNLKSTKSDLDIKCKIHFNYHEALVAFLTIRK